MHTQILLIECTDALGLIHKVTGVLYNARVNLIKNSEFVDKASNLFFMRTEYTGELDKEKTERELRAVLPPNALIRFAELSKKKIAVLATKEHHCLADLIIRSTYEEMNFDIRQIISNHSYLEPLARKFEIPFYHVSNEGKTREQHEEEILRLLTENPPDFIVLAKYMRILSPRFISLFPQRILNIHHSFLPAFIGASPYKQAFERGVKIIGATAHYVTENLDEGPIIAQSVIPVAHTHSPEDMAKAGRDVEKIVLAKALKIVLEERIFLCQKRTIIFE